MNKFLLPLLILFCISCVEQDSTDTNSPEKATVSTQSHPLTPKKKLIEGLPTVGILVFNGFLTNEVIAPIDVFTKKNADGKQLFNVVVLAKENKVYESEEGLKILPDYTLTETPNLNVLVVPSSYDPSKQTSDRDLVDFIIDQHKKIDYIASHCAGAFLVGASGVADHQKIVTFVGGAEWLKKEYPNLDVQDDQKLAVVEDGKIISSNGNLVSYVASLKLLEKMTTTAHRKHVEDELLIDRL